MDTNLAINYDNLTRDQAVMLVGADTVAELDNAQCEWHSTSAWTDNLPDGQHTQCYTASTYAPDECEWTLLTAYYYQPDSAFIDAFGDPIEDLGNLDWVIDHYALQ